MCTCRRRDGARQGVEGLRRHRGDRGGGQATSGALDDHGPRVVEHEAATGAQAPEASASLSDMFSAQFGHEVCARARRGGYLYSPARLESHLCSTAALVLGPPSKAHRRAHGVTVMEAVLAEVWLRSEVSIRPESGS